MEAMPTRRTLTFATLDAAVRDAEHLLAVGYDKAGNWDLGQCCGHLAAWVRFQLDGFPRIPLNLRPVFWVLRHTVGPGQGRKMAEGAPMKAGLPTLKESEVPPGDDARRVAELRETVARWAAHAGHLHPSPALGAATKERYEKVHGVHCAHHLSFLIPKS